MSMMGEVLVGYIEFAGLTSYWRRQGSTSFRNT